MTVTEGYRLGIDFGTSSTVAVLAGPDGRVRPLLFDASPLLSSAVFAAGDGLLTGVDAERAGLGTPAALEPNPKRRIDDGIVWLGEAEHAVVDLITAVLARVAGEAVRVAGGPPAEVVLTHPAGWAASRLAILTAAADRAGLPEVRLLPEPVAAAAHYAGVLGKELGSGRCLVVYDLGAGTFDVAIVRRTGGGFEVVGAGGLTDVGGLDIDAAVVGHARRVGDAGEAWGRLEWPQTPADLQARHQLWQGARAAKEQLSRRPSAELRVPFAAAAVHLSREDFEALARPLLERTVAWTVRLLRDTGVPREEVEGVFLVGGSSRIPLAATLLHRALRVAPTALDHPELVVAEGSLHTPAVPAVPAAPVAAAPVPAAPVAAAPVAAAPVAAAPVAAAPVAAAPVAAASVAAAEAPAVPVPVATGPAAAPVSLATADETPPAAIVEAPVVPATKPKTRAGLTGVEAPPPPDAAAPAARRRMAGFAALAALAAIVIVVAIVASSDPPNVPDPSPTAGPPAGLVADLAIGATPMDVAFNADDTILAVAVNETAELWDVAKRQRIGQPLTGHGGGTYGGRVDGIAFSPDGDTFATASQDGTVRLWSVRQHAQIGQPLVNSPGAKPTDWRNSVAFNRDGSRLAAAGLRGTAVWNLANRTRIAVADGGTWDAEFNPAGDRIATGDEGSVASMWQVPGGAQIGRSFSGHSTASDVSNNVFGVAFSPDAAILATAGGDGTVRLWDVATQKQSGAAIPVADAKDVAFTADGRHLATAGRDGAELWRVSDHQKVLGPLTTTRRLGAERLSFGRNGRILAVAEAFGRNVVLWDVSAYAAVPATPSAQ